MSQAAANPAQMLVLVFQDIDAATQALQQLRVLRGHNVIRAQAGALLLPQTGGDWSWSVEATDLSAPEGALIAALADALIGTLTDRPAEPPTGGPLGARGKKIAVKRIDRGICSARLKPLRRYLLPGSSAIIALLKESEMAHVARALSTTRAIAGAREVWVDLELDLDVLIADVLSPNAVLDPVAIGAAMLSAAGPPEMAQAPF